MYIVIRCLFAAIALLVAPLRNVIAQEQPNRIPITGDRLSGFVLPIEPLAADARFEALRAAAWAVDDTRRLMLQGDVRITLGAYTFHADDAVIWINRIPSAEGEINQIAMYFDRVSDPTKQAGVGAGGERLLVTASTRGQIKLNVALLEHKQPGATPLLQRAQDRLADHLKRLLANPPQLQNRPMLTEPARDPDFAPAPGRRVSDRDLELPSRVELPASRQPQPWLAGPQSTVRFSAERVEIAQGELENTISIMGSIVLELSSNRAEADDDLSQLILTAERAVIFTNPGPLAEMGDQLDADSIRGIYLEGNVSASAENGEYIIRAPRVYYDFQTQRALMLNSVIRLQQRGTRVPVYARALEMKQIAENQWQAEKVNVSTSEFFTPHLAIGADRAVVTQRPASEEGGDVRTNIDAQDMTLRAQGVPFFYWPRFQGDVERVPLKSVTAGTRKHDGFRMLTTWDLFALAGADAPAGVEADLKVDGYTERGAGGGLDLKYDVGDSEGRLDLYGLYDEGTDRTSSGLDVEPDNEFRGVALLEHQSRLSEYWSFQAQASLISDETFITSWREDDFDDRREYETSMYLKHQRENAALTLLGKFALNDFISNSYLLASRQYTVDKLPELTYRRYGDSLFDDALTYSMENRLTRMRLVFEQSTPAELGVRPRAFGLTDEDVELDSVLRARGLRQNWVYRADSRHELALPMHPGIFNVTPFVVGRFTGYDDDFEEFSSDSDELRFHGAAGVRINTQFQRVHDTVENQLFDLHRLRHLVEPYVTLWTAHSSVDQDDLPIYDEEVESLADGSAVQVGVRQVLQTQRGGPGFWRSVDWLMLDASLVFDSEGEPDESPTPQFFDYRPEYSQFGDHFKGRAAWLISDSFSLSGETTYTLDDGEFARGSIGGELRHSPLLTTYVEYRIIEISENELLVIGWTYQLTPKYEIVFNPQWDLREDKFRAVVFRVTRSFPDFDFTVHVRYDDIRNDTQLGASLDLARF